MVDLPGRRVSIRRQIYFCLAGFFFVFLSTILVTPLFDLTRFHLTVGQPSPRKVVARLKFMLEDRDQEDDVRTANILNIVPRFLRDPKIEKKAQERAHALFEDLRKAASTAPADRPGAFPEWLDAGDARQAVKLSESGWADLEKVSRALIHDFMAEEKGILHDAKEAMDLDVHRHPYYEIVYDSNGETHPATRVRGPPDLRDMKGLAGYLESSVGVIYPDLSAPRILTSVLKQVIKPNQAFDREHYRREVERVEEKLVPIYREFSPGNVIVDEYQKVSEFHLLAIREMQKADRARLAVTGVAAFALLSLFTLLMIQYLRVYQPDRLRDIRWMWFIGLLFLFMLGLARLIWTLTDSRLSFAFALPVPAYAMLLTIFYRPRVAMLSSPFLAVSIALLYGCNYQLMLVHTVTSIASVFVVRHTRTMGDIVKAGMFLAFISPISVMASHFVMIDFAINNRELMIAAVGSCVSGALLVPFLTFGLVHFIPILFGLPSDFKILELSDLNHPLLRQMLLEAPGSYQHSQTVSILSEAATEAIGANSLLARVGCYYHDIGKMRKPEYFTENQKYIIDEKGEIIGKETKDIKPSLYASVLKSHVKMGVEMAKEHRLPQILIDFIEQHHGTSLMKSLYDAALSRSTDEDTAERESFIYPGPKPKYKETAVVMLADTVEAAVRSLDNPTPHRIEEEVQRLVQSKVAEGQLDDSSLTMKDLKKVEEAFTRVLTSMYHTRIAYPSDEELKRKEKQKGET